MAQTPFFDSQTSTERIFTSWMPAAVIASMCVSSIIVPRGTMTEPSMAIRSSAVERPRMREASEATTWPASTMARMRMPRSEPQSGSRMTASCATSTRRRVR